MSADFFVGLAVGVSLPVLYLVAQWTKSSYYKFCDNLEQIKLSLLVGNFMQGVNTGLNVVKLIQSCDAEVMQQFNFNNLTQISRKILDLVGERERPPRPPARAAMDE